MPSILSVRTKRARFVDQLSRWALAISVFCFLAPTAFAGAFGTVVPIGGHAADIALDEARGVVYVANYTANRIDVVSTRTLKVQSTIAVALQPASLALSPDGKYLVVTHVSNFDPLKGGTPMNSLSVIYLNGTGSVKQTYAFDGTPPLGVAFGNDGLALIVTTVDFRVFDPASGYSFALDTIAGVTTKTLPQPIGQFPRDIIRASISASGDGSRIFGTLEAANNSQNTLEFQYDTATKRITAQFWTNTPPSGPRVVSVDKTGTFYMTGWSMHRANDFVSMAQFSGQSAGDFALGSHAVDSASRTIYAQIGRGQSPASWPKPSARYSDPVLQVVDSDNLAVREQLKLAQNLSGRSVMSADGKVMYAVSDSGLTALPVGQLSQVHRVVASQEQLLFRGNWCSRTIQSQTLAITDPGGGSTDFTLTTTLPGLAITPDHGTTPATVTVSIDPNAYQNQKGTTEGLIEIHSGQGVNLPPPVRVLVNNREPDQRGTIFSQPGMLVDVMADPVRNRFYVIRQDKNLVLIFDGSNYRQIGALRTGNTPWSMAMTRDNKYMLIGADNSQVAYVYDLDTFQFQKYIVMPSGHYPRSIAVSGNAILAACRVAGPKHTIDRIQMWGTATEYPSLGVWDNDVDQDTYLSASPSGSTILGVMKDGRVLLYNANEDTFVAGRHDLTSADGAFLAISDDMYVIDRTVMDASLSPIYAFPLTGDQNTSKTSGFAVVDGMGLRTKAADVLSPGVIERVDLSALPFTVRPTRMIEAPTIEKVTVTVNPPVCDTIFLGLCQPPTTTITVEGLVFVRSLAPLANRNAIVSLSISGFTALAWNYDAAVADPRITSVVNAADRTPGVAPGGLISVMGTDLSPVNAATNEIPLPTALGDSCLTVNGVLVPLIFVSPTQINGQLPFNTSGTGTMILRTPGGVSNSFQFPILANAPAAFLVNVPGWDVQFPTVVRASNNLQVTPSNPVHLDDWLVIYVTGLGLTTPELASGDPGNADPLNVADVVPEVTLDGAKLWVDFAGMAPGQVGVYQINVRVPFHSVQTGMNIPLVIKQGTYTTTLNVRVVE